MPSTFIRDSAARFVSRAVLRLFPAIIATFLCLASCVRNDAPVEKPVPRIPSTGGIASFVQGKVFLRRDGVEAALAIDAPVYASDTIRTGKNSSCELDFPGIGRVMLQAETQIDVARLDLVGKKAQLAAKSGGVLAKISKLASRDSFLIKTSGVACGVRGTVFSVVVEKNGARVAVTEGSVALFPSALIETGIYDPADLSGAESMTDPVALDSFVALDPGEAAFCSAKDYREAGDAIIESAAQEGADPSAIIKEAAEAVRPDSVPIEDSEKKRLEDFQAKPSSVEPEYIMTAMPVEGRTEKIAEGWEWIVRSNWNREAVDLAALPPMKLDTQIFVTIEGGEGRAIQDGDSLRYEVTKPVPATVWSVQTLLPRMRLEQGRAYRISFVAWAEKPHRAHAVVAEPEKDLDGDGNIYTPINEAFECVLGTTPERYSQFFYYGIPSLDGFTPALHFGQDAGSVWLREFRVDEIRDPSVYERARGDEMVSSSRPFNGDFSRGFLGWKIFSMDGTKYEGFQIVDGALRYEQDAPIDPIWHSQFHTRQGFAIKKGNRYRLEFSMRAEKRPGSKSLGFMDFYLCEFDKDEDGDGTKWTLVTPWMMAPFSPEWTRYSLEFPSYADLERARLTFNVGAVDSWIEVDDISFGDAP